MPKLKKQKLHLRMASLARGQKKSKKSEAALSPPSSSSSTQGVTLPLEGADQPSTSGLGSNTEEYSSSSTSDSDFDPEESIKSDPLAMMEEFTADWIATLSRDDLYSLSILLFYIFQQDFQLLVYPASKIIAKYINRHYKTVQKWRVDFIESGGEVPEFVKGRYKRMNAISKDEDLTRKATMYVRENAFKKGAPNMTSRSFCSWVNDDLLPNSTLESGAPRKISVEVARKWLHEMGFKVKRITKGIYVDGHERKDVVNARSEFLKEMNHFRISSSN